MVSLLPDLNGRFCLTVAHSKFGKMFSCSVLGAHSYEDIVCPNKMKGAYLSLHGERTSFLKLAASKTAIGSFSMTKKCPMRVLLSEEIFIKVF